MKDHVAATVVQYASSWLEPEKNRDRMSQIVADEARSGTDLVVFPELSTAGYVSPIVSGFDLDFALQYAGCAEVIPGPTTDAIASVCRGSAVHVAFGILERDATVSSTLYNSMALVGPDGLIGVYRKVHLPLVEKHYFRAGSEMPVFETALGNIGLSICYDGRFPELSRVLALRGCEIICSGWAIPEIPDLVLDENLKHRAYTRAVENSVYYLAANRAGIEGDALFIGHSAVVAPDGAVLAYSERNDEDVLRAVLRSDVLERNRAFLPVFNDRRPELYGEISAPPA